MTKTVTATEAKNRLGAYINEVQKQGEPVIIESRGLPAAVITSFQDYEELQAFRDQQRRVQAMAKLRDLGRRVSANNEDLSDAEVNELADRIVLEAVESLETRGAIRFEEQ